MQIQVNTDNNIEGREALANHVRAVVATALSRHEERITRVEVHLSDQNSGKGGSDDKRCVMEVRLTGRQPVAVTDDAATVEAAVEGAVGKLERLIETTLGRLHDERHHQGLSEPSAMDVAERTSNPVFRR